MFNTIKVNNTDTGYTHSIFDISDYNSGATYNDLSSALAAIPESKLHGGMTVRYVLTEDNNSTKYVQYRLMSDSWSIDTADWALCSKDVLVDNHEFVKVVTDKEGKILWAIKTDGSIYWGAGVPQQVIDYVEKRIAELSLDEYEDIVSFLGELITGDETLQELLDKKVDGEYVENLEYIEVKTDAEDKILEATEKDGTKVFGGDAQIEGNTIISGDATIFGNVDIQGATYTLMQNQEWLRAIVDAQNHILCGIKADGSIYFNSLTEIPSPIKEALSEVAQLDERIAAIESVFSLIYDPEYIAVETDSEGKKLGGRKADGSKFENLPMEFKDKVSIKGNTIDSIQDPEKRKEIKTDFEGKIISFRDKEGVLHENVGIKTNSLRLTEEGMTEFQQALKESGFHPGSATDWSEYITGDGDTPLNIPKPKCIMLNILSDFNLLDIRKVGKPGAEEGVNYDVPMEIEFWDMNGNYFKKWVTVSALGNSSYAFMKRNLAFDFYDSKAGGDAFSFKIGDWVPQDSYHLKAYYTDAFRGINVVNYELYKQIIDTRNTNSNRTFKKYLPGIKIWSDGSESSDNADVANNYDCEARCFPDGIPCVIYQQGEFWGIFAWQIKKHRDNYHLSSKDGNNIHLDGTISGGNLFLVNGRATGIGWDATTDAGFEVRNPKANKKPSKSYLFLQSDGTPYDADLNCGEIMGKYLNDAQGYPDPTTPNPLYDNSNKNHKVCAKTKDNILKLSTYIPELKQMESDSATAEQIKERFEEMFDVDNLIDYIVFSAFIGNTDGFAKNWQWVTWDGNIWTVNPYDCDLTYGSTNGRGHVLDGPGSDAITKSRDKNNPCGWIWAYYRTELEARYKELRDNGILTSDNLIHILSSWISKFGVVNFKKEFSKWNESPAHRPSFLNTEYWEYIGQAYGHSATYNENAQYEVGDEVVWMGHNLHDARIACRYRCVKAHQAYEDAEHTMSDFYPCYSQYTNWPQIMGHYDSPVRVKYWIDQTLSTQVDAAFNYGI